ncbi:UNVERIFIED_CONTAM: hypothetical protein GTU68_016928 [Idotea baltica]|nr:hypothetical protein [Idotea baltica]
MIHRYTYLKMAIRRLPAQSLPTSHTPTRMRVRK